MSTQFAKSSDVEWETFDGEAVVVSIDAGHVCSLNRSGTYVWECSDGKTSVQAIAEQLASEAGRDARETENEVRRFCEEMTRRGLLKPAQRATSDPSKENAPRFQAPYVAPIVQEEGPVQPGRPGPHPPGRPSPRSVSGEP